MVNDSIANSSQTYTYDVRSPGAGNVGAFILGIILLSTGVTYSLVILFFNIRYRKLRVVRMSSPNVNMLIGTGALTMYVSVFLFSMDTSYFPETWAYNALCQARVWVLTCSSTVAFGALLAKAWRAKRIFHNSKAKKVIIKDYVLFIMVGILLLPDFAILILWLILDPLQLNHDNFLNVNESQNLIVSNESTIIANTDCSCELFPLWTTLLMVYKLALLLTGSWISWKVKTVPIPPLNDSMAIFLSTVVVALTGSTVAAISYHLPSSGRNIIIMAAVWFYTTFVLTASFLPKLSLIFSQKGNVGPLGKLGSPISAPSSQQQYSDNGSQYNLAQENGILRKLLMEKDVKIEELQECLRSTEEQSKKTNSEHDVNKNDSGLDVDLSLSSGLEDTKSNILDVGFVDYAPPHVQNDNGMDTLKDSHNYVNIPRTHPYLDHNRRRNSLRTKTFHRKYRRRSSRKAHLHDQEDLTGSIVDSYGLNDDWDTRSYISHHMSDHCEALDYLDHIVHSSPVTMCSDCNNHNFATLDNDFCYPTNRTSEAHRERRRSRHSKHKRRRSRKPKRLVSSDTKTDSNIDLHVNGRAYSNSALNSQEEPIYTICNPDINTDNNPQVLTLPQMSEAMFV